VRQPPPWRPQRVLVTPAALDWEHGRDMVARAEARGIEVVRLKANRLAGLADPDPRRAVLRQATLGDVQPGQDLDPRDERLGQDAGGGRHVTEQPIHPHADRQSGAGWFEVDVARACL
jgi:hypothetical protein